MSSDGRTKKNRIRLGFADAVRKKFAFLADYGLSETEALPTIVRYRKSDLELEVYQGRLSYEIGINIGHGDEKFSMGALIRAVDPVGGGKYRDWAATSSEALAAGLDRLAELLRRYGERALRNDLSFFEELGKQGEAWAETYSLDVLVAQIRPKAELAFRENRYREAAELYERISARLSVAERMKLAIARKRSISIAP